MPANDAHHSRRAGDVQYLQRRNPAVQCKSRVRARNFSAVIPSLSPAFLASRALRATSATAKEAFPLDTNNVPTLANSRQMVSHPDGTGPEMLTRSDYSRRRGLLHFIEDLLHSVTQEEIAGVLQQRLAEVFRVNRC